ncbi:MAG: ABC transporter ATP-binding protein [Bacteroidota bacterium]
MAVIIRQVDKSFEQVRALKQVDFRVGDGELFGVIGPDGAGKSTLFRIVVSLLVPDYGTCEVNGFDVVKRYRDVRRLIGYMPGRFSLYMDLSVEENLHFYATVFGTSVRANYDLIREVYRHIEPFRKRLAGRLSGGMKQKLALSCALIHRPRVLILDEPTTGVDAVSRQEFWEMLKKIRQEGITIMVSTPYMDEAVLCDRVALMQKGRVLDVAVPGEISSREQAPLFALRSRREVFPFLERIRNMKGCRSAWLFGDELHVTLESRDAEPAIRAEVERWEDPTLEWTSIPASIEDRFMRLIQGERDDGNENGSFT